MAKYRVVDKDGFVKFTIPFKYANQIFENADGYLNEKFGKGTFEVTWGCKLTLNELSIELNFNAGDCLIPII